MDLHSSSLALSAPGPTFRSKRLEDSSRVSCRTSFSAANADPPPQLLIVLSPRNEMVFEALGSKFMFPILALNMLTATGARAIGGKADIFRF